MNWFVAGGMEPQYFDVVFRGGTSFFMGRSNLCALPVLPHLISHLLLVCIVLIWSSDQSDWPMPVTCERSAEETRKSTLHSTLFRFLFFALVVGSNQRPSYRLCSHWVPPFFGLCFARPDRNRTHQIRSNVALVRLLVAVDYLALGTDSAPLFNCLFNLSPDSKATVSSTKRVRKRSSLLYHDLFTFRILKQGQKAFSRLVLSLLSNSSSSLQHVVLLPVTWLNAPRSFSGFRLCNSLNLTH